jgi:hypothetical protein
MRGHGSALRRYNISLSPSLRVYEHNRRLSASRDKKPAIQKIVANPTDDLHCAGVEGKVIELTHPGTAKALYGNAGIKAIYFLVLRSTRRSSAKASRFGSV